MKLPLLAHPSPIAFKLKCTQNTVFKPSRLRKPMRTVVTEKVTGGKLVRIKVEFTDSIRTLQISGDFFLHPEETLEALEKALVGIPVSTPLPALEEHIATIVRMHKAEMLGITPGALAHAIRSALDHGAP